MTPGEFVIGVDIGGTKVAAGIVNPEGQILASTRAPMVARKTAEDGLAAVRSAIDALREGAPNLKPAAIGISTPGWVDAHTGTVLKASNLPCWQEYPLGKVIAAHYRLPARVENDANCAALAEAVWGAGADYRNVFYVSLGTGIGTGMVNAQRVYSGRTGMAGEGGHMTIDYAGPKCPCGKQGCIEMYASGPAIGARARAVLTRSSRSLMLELADGKVSAVSAHTVGKAALNGDPLAVKVLQEAADYLAIWLGNIIDLLEPDVIVVGGGLGHLMASFFSYIRGRLTRWSINPRAQQLPIVSALYGAESGIAGSAALWLQPTASEPARAKRSTSV
ncbi:MAG: ROK family protein [Terriglobales bacterium]